MSKQRSPAEQGPQKNELNRRETWMVDDDDSIARSFGRLVKSFLPDQTIIHYQTGEAAITEFKRRIEAGETLPASIIMDGNLELDENDQWRKGDKVVAAMRDIYPDSKITIIAYSNCDILNERMRAAGASRIGDKNNPMETCTLLQGISLSD